MKNICVLSGFLATLFMFHSCSVSKTGNSSPLQLKVLTYNIHHANPPSKPDFIDLPAIVKVIKESKADIVGLQEIDVHTERSGKGLDQAAELGRLTGMHYYFVKGIDYQGGEYGVAILSRFPIIKSDSLRLPMKEGIGGEPRVLAVITVEPVKGKKVVFANTHLDLKPETRILQARAIVNYLNKIQSPVIFCGDLNAKPGSEPINLFDEYLTRSSIPNGLTIPQINPRSEIDFIMFKPASRFNILKHEVINEPYASDHLPVLVELELN